MKNKKNFITLDELTKKYLNSDVFKSLPDVDIDVQKIELEFNVEKVRFHLAANKISIATFLISLLIILAILIRG